MIKRTAVVATLVASLIPLNIEQVNAVECSADSALQMTTSSAPQPLAFYGEDIGLPAITELWRIVSDTPHPHRFIGKSIAADQNWFGDCVYPGIGIAAGSGYTWRDKNVTFYVWAEGVDLAVARETVRVIAGVTTTTTSTTTTTTTAPVAEAFAVSVSAAVETPVASATSTTSTAVSPAIEISVVAAGYPAVTQSYAVQSAKTHKPAVVKKKKKVTKRVKCTRRTKTKVCIMKP